MAANSKSFSQLKQETLNTITFQDKEFDLLKLKTEFDLLYALCMSNKDVLKNTDIAKYLNDLCEFLIDYYQKASVKAELHALQKKQKTIKAILLSDGESLLQGIEDNNPTSTLRTYASADALNSYIGFVNVFRLKAGYNNFITTAAIQFLQTTSIIMQLNNSFDETILSQFWSSKNFIESLEKTEDIRNALSVGLYLTRFILNLTLLIQHWLIAVLNQDELSPKNVVYQELQERGAIMLNDIVWATVNLLTNYNNFFGISSEAASQMSLVFLTFDIALLAIRWALQSKTYRDRLQDLERQRRDLDISEFTKAVIAREIDMLQDEWQATCAAFKIQISGATITMLRFALFITLGPAVTGTALEFGLMLLAGLGSTLSNVAADYKKYAETNIALAREDANWNLERLSEETCEQVTEFRKNLNANCDAAFDDFVYSLLSDLITNAALLTAFAVSWPLTATVLLAAGAIKLKNAETNAAAFKSFVFAVLSVSLPNIAFLTVSAGCWPITLALLLAAGVFQKMNAETNEAAKTEKVNASGKEFSVYRLFAQPQDENRVKKAEMAQGSSLLPEVPLLVSS